MWRLRRGEAPALPLLAAASAAGLGFAGLAIDLTAPGEHLLRAGLLGAAGAADLALGSAILERTRPRASALLGQALALFAGAAALLFSGATVTVVWAALAAAGATLAARERDRLWLAGAGLLFLATLARLAVVDLHQPALAREIWFFSLGAVGELSTGVFLNPRAFAPRRYGGGPLPRRLVAIAWVYTLINLAQTYFFYCSRIIFAWSFDRLIPERVCYIHPTLRSPIIAILIISLIAEIGIIDAARGGVMGAQLNFVFFAVCTQLVPVLAITLFPFTKKDLFENSSAMVKRRVGKVPVITIVGAITMAYLLWMIIASFLYPAVGGRIGSGTLLTLAGFVISGLIVLYAARAYRMRCTRRSY